MSSNERAEMVETICQRCRGPVFILIGIVLGASFTFTLWRNQVMAKLAAIESRLPAVEGK